MSTNHCVTVEYFHSMALQNNDQNAIVRNSKIWQIVFIFQLLKVQRTYNKLQNHLGRLWIIYWWTLVSFFRSPCILDRHLTISWYCIFICFLFQNCRKLFNWWNSRRMVHIDFFSSQDKMLIRLIIINSILINFDNYVFQSKYLNKSSLAWRSWTLNRPNDILQ